MKAEKVDFRNLNLGTKIGISMIIISWSYYLITMSYLSGNISLIQMTIGLFISFAALSAKRWGIIIAAAYNFFMAVMIAVDLYRNFHSPESPALIYSVKAIGAFMFILSSLMIAVPGIYLYHKKRGNIS